MTKTLRVAEQDLGPQDMIAMRNELIIFRNEALKHTRMDWAVGLSLIIVTFTTLCQEKWGEEFKELLE